MIALPISREHSFQICRSASVFTRNFPTRDRTNFTFSMRWAKIAKQGGNPNDLTFNCEYVDGQLVKKQQ